MTVGLAFSGGGITGLLASMCVMNSLNSTMDLSASDISVSTASGGSIGYGLFVNAGERLYFPRYDATVTYDEVSSEQTSNSKSTWFGNVNNYLPDSLSLASGHSQKSHPTTASLARKRGGLSWGPTEKGWWIDAIDACFWLGYGVHDYDITAGPRDWHVNFALLEKDACPISVNSKTGVFGEAESSLTLSELEMTTQTFSSPRGFTLSDDVSLLDALAYSSSFWVASIVESRLQYATLKSTIDTTKASDVGAVYFTDGGFVDTTGIVSHLQRKVTSIVAFYNNNDDLTELNSTFAYLFGVSTPTDSMNALHGPELGQVFDSALYDEVIANLTAPSVQRATLDNLQVRANSYLGVEAYTLPSLVIISNQYSPEFADSFDDDKIGAGLSSDFPNKFAVGLPTLDTNVLCMFNDYKVQRYRDEIQAALQS